MGRGITNRHEWIAELERLIPEIVPLQLSRKKNTAFFEERSGVRIMHDADAYNLSNSPEHDELIQRSVRNLLKRTDAKTVGHLLDELTSRKAYGAFSELAAYDWLERACVSFTPQVSVGPSEVLNPNGSTLDGVMDLAGQKIYFDVKGFGFIDHKLKRLRERLGQHFPGSFVSTEGLVSVSLDEVQDLLESGFQPLVQELAASSFAKRGTLHITRRPRREVNMSLEEHDPKRLAKENCEYSFRDRGQFARQAPFVLIYIVHPWFSQGTMHQNFAGFVDDFARHFAECTFTSFQQDTTIVDGLPKHEVANLLSAVAFVNVWPQASSAGSGPTARILLNPHARWPMCKQGTDWLRSHLGPSLAVMTL